MLGMDSAHGEDANVTAWKKWAWVAPQKSSTCSVEEPTEVLCPPGRLGGCHPSEPKGSMTTSLLEPIGWTWGRI